MDEIRYASLSSSAVFGGLSKATLERLLKDADVVHQDAGEYFFLANDLGDSLFLLESGEVDVIKALKGRFAGRVAKPVTLEEMDCAIAAGAADRAAAGNH